LVEVVVKLLAGVVGFFLSLFQIQPNVQAEPRELFSTSAPVTLGGQTAAVPVQIFAETIESVEPRLRIGARAVLDDLLAKAALFLEEEIRRRDRGCRERWSAWDGSAAVRDGALHGKVTARAEKWICEKVLGSELKTRVAEETATVHVALTPSIENGVLKVELSGFRVDDLSQLLRDFGLEGYLRASVEAELRKINADPAIMDLPAPLKEIGYAYESVVLRTADGIATADLTIMGPNDPVALLAAVAKLLR
jgi:hypothetical protein